MKSKLTGLVAIGLLSTLGIGRADPVVVGANEWRQLTDTMGFTWQQVKSVCPTVGTPCAGTIVNKFGSSVSFDGWTWATVPEIRNLFDAIIAPGTANFVANPNLYTEAAGETYIDNAIAENSSLATAGQFVRTILNCGAPCADPANSFIQRWVVGWSATSTDAYENYAYTPNLMDEGNKVVSPVDEAWLSAARATVFSNWDYGDLGVWLYRPYSGKVRLTGLTLKSALVAGCKSVTGTITLSGPAPAAGVVVSLSDTLNHASVPATLKILAGVATKDFTVTTSPVTSNESGTVSAMLDATTLSQPLTVRPMGLSSVTLTPLAVVGSQPVAGKATLECKAAGPGAVTVKLASDNAAVASPVAASISVPQGLPSATFDVVTKVVQANSFANISGTANGITKSKKLTVKVAASVSPTRLSFGSVFVGDVSAPMIVTLTNKGAVPFSINSIALTGLYASSFAQTSTCAATLAAGASCEISVKFKPLAVASRSAKLSIATSATVEPINVPLSGTGL